VLSDIVVHCGGITTNIYHVSGHWKVSSSEVEGQGDRQGRCTFAANGYPSTSVGYPCDAGRTVWRR